MAISVNSTQSSLIAGTGTSGSVSFNCPSSSLLLVSIAIQDATRPTTVTWNGSSMTLARRDDTTRSTSVWYIQNPDTGTFSLTVDRPDSAKVAVGFIALSGTDTTTPIGNVSGASSNSTSATVSFTATAADSLIVDACFSDAATLTPNAGQTGFMSQVNFEGANDAAASYRQLSGTSVTESYTVGSSNAWIISAVEVKAGEVPTFSPIVMSF